MQWFNGWRSAHESHSSRIESSGSDRRRWARRTIRCGCTARSGGRFTDSTRAAADHDGVAAGLRDHGVVVLGARARHREAAAQSKHWARTASSAFRPRHSRRRPFCWRGVNFRASLLTVIAICFPHYSQEGVQPKPGTVPQATHRADSLIIHLLVAI